MAAAAKAPYRRPTITPGNRLDLARLGLHPDAINALEIRLAAIEPYLLQRPPTNDVRSPLLKLQKHLHAVSGIDKMLARGGEAGHDEAHRHLRLAACRAGFANWQEALTSMVQVIDKAVALAPNAKRGPKPLQDAVRHVHELLVEQGLPKLTKGEMFSDIVDIAFTAASRQGSVPSEWAIQQFRKARAVRGDLLVGVWFDEA